MKNQLIKNENQIVLFDLIQNKLPANLTLVDVISDVLDISTDAAYRRIRGDKLVDIEELIKLCHHFKISLDSITGVTEENQIRCTFDRGTFALIISKNGHDFISV